MAKRATRALPVVAKIAATTPRPAAPLAQPEIQVMTLAELQQRPGQHAIIPMPDNKFAPAIRQGDFVIIDLDRRDPALGALVWLRYRGGGTNFAMIRGAAPAPFKGVSIAFGRQTVHYLNGKTERWPSGDVMAEEYLRECITGHVVGVVGNAGAIFNWERAA